MSGSVNKTFTLGRLGKDPKIIYGASGDKVAKFSIGTSFQYTKDGQKIDKTEWINCSAFGKLADFIEKYSQKGDLVFVEGSLRTTKWEKDGTDHYSTEVIAGRFQSLSSKRDKKESDFPTSLANLQNDDIDQDLPF